MENTYLKKLVHQETLNVKLQFIQEHLDLAKNELTKTSNYSKDIEQTSILLEQDESNEKWDNEDLQKFLIDLPNSKVKELGLNRPGYEVTVTITPTVLPNPSKPILQTKPYKNLFHFNNDGSVYDFNLMRRLGYTFDGNEITIVSKNPNAFVSTAGDNVQLATIDKNGKFTNLNYTADESDPLAAQKSWLDPLQQILDYAGIIPVIGDALDAVNAALYFYRGRYFEGFLSFIAIIPVVGSIIALSVKSALKVAAKGTAKITKAGATNFIKRW